jgi:hypothetical protein
VTAYPSPTPKTGGAKATWGERKSKVRVGDKSGTTLFKYPAAFELVRGRREAQLWCATCCSRCGHQNFMAMNEF